MLVPRPKIPNSKDTVNNFKSLWFNSPFHSPYPYPLSTMKINLRHTRKQENGAPSLSLIQLNIYNFDFRVKRNRSDTNKKPITCLFVTIYQPVWLMSYTFLCVYYTVIKVGYFFVNYQNLFYCSTKSLYSITNTLCPICPNPYQDSNSHVVEMKVTVLKVWGST